MSKETDRGSIPLCKGLRFYISIHAPHARGDMLVTFALYVGYVIKEEQRRAMVKKRRLEK